MSRRRSKTVPEAEATAQLWKLELTGTSPLQHRELEAAVAAIGWQRLDSRVERGKGLTRVYVCTDPNETPEHILTELAQRDIPVTRLPSVTRLAPTTWEAVADRIKAAVDARHAYARSRACLPPTV